jgi:nucleoside-diphosphate-sugar epimerase
MTSAMTRWADTPVLVTGATGFIGANLTRRLIALGARVHVLIRPGTNLWRLEDVASGLALHGVDMNDRAGLSAAVRRAAPEIVFHLAADGAARHDAGAAQLFATNVLGTLNLLDAAEPLAYRRFVHIGGSSEYGPRDAPLRETARLEPVTPYGASKAAATLAAQQYARAHGRPIAILRPFSVYGPWESSSRLIPTATLAALEGRDLSLTSPGYRRDLVHVDDVVEACVIAATRDVTPGEIVNVGTGRQSSNEEVVGIIERVSGCVIQKRVGEYRARLSDTTHWVADTAKAEQVLGWKASRSLEAGLRDSVAWWAAHRKRSAVVG